MTFLHDVKSFRRGIPTCAASCDALLVRRVVLPGFVNLRVQAASGRTAFG